MQAPDVWEGHGQQHEISNDGGDRDPDEKFGHVDACASCDRQVPDLADGSACEDRCCFLHHALAGRSHLLGTYIKRQQKPLLHRPASRQ